MGLDDIIGFGMDQYGGGWDPHSSGMGVDIIGADFSGDFSGADYAMLGPYAGIDMATGALDMATGAEQQVARAAVARHRMMMAQHMGTPWHPMAPTGRMGLNAMQKQAIMAALAAKHAGALVPRAALKTREYTLGFAGSPTAIAGGAITPLKASPQVPFKGRRLIIPSDVAGALIITAFTIGKNPVLVSADPVSGRAFTEIGVGVDLNMDTAQISQVIALTLQNTSGASVSVTPTLIGTAME